MRLKNFTTAILLQALLVGNSFGAPAVSTSKIIVIVNKDPISQSDLDDRIKLITLMSGMSAKKQDMENMRNQVLQSLIQEKIQIHAAKTKRLSVSEMEVEKAMQAMAKDNGMTYDQFLAILSDNGVREQTLASRIMAQMYWVKYIRQQYAPVVHVSDTEVSNELKKIEKTKNQTQYLVSEITLLASNPAQVERVRFEANKLVDDLRAGANFGMLAQQLSKDSTAAAGGDLGWASLEQVDPAIADVLRDLNPGEISCPIRTPAGFKIIKLREIRQAGEADPNESTITFCQAFFPVTPESPQEELMIVAPKVEETLAVAGCENFKSKVRSFNIDLKYNANIKMGQLPEQLKVLLKSAPLGECIQPIMTESGLLVQMVCKREAAKFVLPDSEQIRDELEQQKLSRQAARELQRLMSTAYLNFKDQKYASVVR